VVLVALAALRGTAWHIVGCSVYGASLVIMYAISTLYHSLRSRRAKHIFQILDHCAIFLLIAGTYTPFTLVNLRGPWGWTLLGLIWAFAVGGILWKVFQTDKYPIVSSLLYLAAGWLAIIAIKPMLQHVAMGGIVLIFLGGLAYSFGLIFFGWQRLRYHHALWHVFVLAGSIFHYAAVLLYVLPPARA
jgi:hemolysin III